MTTYLKLEVLRVLRNRRYLILALAVPIGFYLLFGKLMLAGIQTAIAGLGLLSFLHILRLNIQLREAREDLARMAVAEERGRFARDPHDLLGHSLSVIALKSELAGELVTTDPAGAATEMREVEQVARRSWPRSGRRSAATGRSPWPPSWWAPGLHSTPPGCE